MQHIRNIICNILDSSYSWFEKHWLFTTFILKISSIWFSLFIAFFGTNWLVSIDQNNNKSFTPWGLISTIIIISITIYIAIVEKYHELNNKEKKEAIKTSAEKYLLDTVNSNVKDICTSKFETQLNAIKEAYNNPNNIPEIYTKPCVQLEVILDGFSECLEKLISSSSHRFKKTDFRVELFYNFPNENASTWKVAQNKEVLSLPLDKIINDKSTFNYLLKSGKPYVFFNSKKRARINEHYLRDKFDHLDEDDEPKGSIACYRLDYGDHTGLYIQAVLFLATHENKFIDEAPYFKNFKKEKDAIEQINKDSETLAVNIFQNLVKNFENRIGIELCNYYMQFLKEKQNKAQRPNP